MMLCMLCRYLSRCLLIQIHAPCLEMSMKSYSELPGLLNRATSAVGMLISLGEAFSTRGISEMDANIGPRLRKFLEGLGVIPRVLPSYALLFWFTMEVGYITVIYCRMH